MKQPNTPNSDQERLSLDRSATHLLEECRMVLPGIQAMFGFQLIAVFNAGFFEHLNEAERRIHLASILCMVTAVALVMAPAALHRQVQPDRVSRRFIRVSSLLLTWSMLPLAAGTALDVYLIARIILGAAIGALVVALSVVVLFFLLWLVLPKYFGIGARAGH